MRDQIPLLGYTLIDIDALPLNEPLRFALYYRTEGPHPKLVRIAAPGKVLSSEIQQRLIARGIHRLFVRTQELRPMRRNAEDNGTSTSERSQALYDNPLRKQAHHIYVRAVETIQHILDSPLAAERVEEACAAVKDMVGVILEDESLLKHLSTLTTHDYYTYTHSVNVCVYSLALAYRIGEREPDVLESVGVGGMFHDLGKKQIASAILNKPGRLNDAEWELIKKHPLFGAQQLYRQQQVAPSVVVGVLQHHERFDGLGYPSGIAGEAIHLFGRIICVADVFDALTTNRSYKNATSPARALRIMIQEMRGHFDPALLIAFAKFITETKNKLSSYPPSLQMPARPLS